jgi:DNA-binding GntR family transcriptional regulator
VPVNPNDPKAPYLQIADELRQAIVSGKLQPGDRLDSGRRLAQQHGVSPMTVQQAIRELRNEGLIVTWQGRGVFVRGGTADGSDTNGEDDLAGINRRLDAMHDAIAALESRVGRLETGPAPSRRRDR